MKQFCKEVLKFLQSEYNDSYRFEIEYCNARPPICEIVKLTIETSPQFKMIITNDSMQYLFGWYLSGEFIEERKQYRWQKELIDMIEGS